jgi:hypothetical protein
LGFSGKVAHPNEMILALEPKQAARESARHEIALRGVKPVTYCPVGLN